MNQDKKNRISELAPCGVFCGACPSFNNSCYGCGSDDKNQKRKSKFNCKIRTCCYNEKGFDFCVDCNQFPCRLIHKKLLSSHPDDPRYKYRHEIPGIFIKKKTLGIEAYLDFQTQRWKCKSCGERVHFYHYKCNFCGKEQMV